MRKLFYAIRHYLKMRKIRRRNRSLGVDIALIIILGAFGLFSLYPLIYIIVSAFKPMSEVFIFPPRLVVENPTLNNFFDLGFIIEEFDIPFSRYAFNTLIITGLGTAGTVLLGSMAAFPLAKYEFPGSKLMSNIIVYALMFSSSVTAIPNYFIMSAMNLIDTIWAVIKTVMPRCKPAWITLIILSFQSMWGTTGGVFIYSEEWKPLSYVLSQIVSSGISRTGVSSAVSLIMLVVPVTVFVISQSNVLETMATSGMKG